MTLLQMDYIKVAAADAKRVPYSSENIRSVIKHCITMGYGDTTDITPDIRLTFHNAGHILGSSICHFHIGEGLYNIAFSGDIKFERTWLFNPAVNHFPRAEALIIESTYGGRDDFQPSRKEATDRLKDIIRQSLKKKGKVLVPVFAVGRSQEVMIVLENLVRSKEIPEIPVYLDGMIWEATAIHTAYPSTSTINYGRRYSSRAIIRCSLRFSNALTAARCGRKSLRTVSPASCLRPAG